eukprot:gene13285-19132_t
MLIKENYEYKKLKGIGYPNVSKHYGSIDLNNPYLDDASRSVLGDHRLLKFPEDQAKYAQEMEAIAIHMLTITYDIDGDTTAVECRKMLPMKYKSVRSIRKYNNTSARILMLKDFDNLFYTIFTDINNRDEPARFQIRLTTLLNPSLQHLHNKVFKFDLSKSLRDIVNLSETNT